LVKSDIREPAMYGGILLLLMLFRLRMWTQKGASSKSRSAPVAVKT